MIQTECLFEDGQVGTITAAQIVPAETSYKFMPYRSLAHQRLVSLVEQEKRAPVTLLYQGQRVDMIVTNISARSITLVPANADE